jgi:alkylated DNA repair dioxygenase AlkB
MANVRSQSVQVSWQPSLLDARAAEPSIDASFAAASRIALDADAWVDHVRGWVRGAGVLFADVIARAPWSLRRVRMYDRMVDEPRLTAWYDQQGLHGDALPPVVPAMAAALSARYAREFDAVGAALYRDGRDSVAWHGDRIPVEITEPIVAVVSLGSLRTLRMRCKADHRLRHAFPLAPGDALVMGGTSQRSWEHCVPKVAHAGPRISLQFRHTR